MHFYSETDGKIEPRHFVPMAKDPSKLRPSRVTDARKAAKEGSIWYPSVTTILNVLDKPALTNWKVDRHIEIAFHEAATNEPVEDYVSRVKRLTQQKLDEAPKAGTDIHKVLEDNLLVDDAERNEGLSDVEHKILDVVWSELLQREIDVAHDHLEKYFVDKVYGYAGCSDLVPPGWVIDYKSKQEAAKFKPGKMAYPEHYRQLAAYGKAIHGDNFRAANIFICLETGEIDFHEHSQEDLEKGWLDFVDCLNIFNRNTYRAA